MASFSCKAFGHDPLEPPRRSALAHAGRSGGGGRDRRLVLGSGAESPGERARPWQGGRRLAARRRRRASSRSAAIAAAPADLRPSARREADAVTGPAGIVVEESGILALDAVMRVMEDSFDPAFGEAWTGAAMRRPAADAGRMAVACARGRGGGRLRARPGRRPRSRASAARGQQARFAGPRRRPGSARPLHQRSRSGAAPKSSISKSAKEIAPFRLYKQAGFREVGRRRNYYNGRDGQLYDALTLARSINS